MATIRRRKFLAAAGGGATGVLAGCLSDKKHESASVLDDTLTLTTTTSTYDTGLLGGVNAAFEDRYGARVKAIALGTGAALETARSGDADLVMVHARSLEDEFLREGHGVNRRDLMFNDFVVVGPDDDPADIEGMASVTNAFRAISESKVGFVSRGDRSGTHTKELAIWDTVGIKPSGEWYREAGTGMGQVLVQADQSEIYTLADRGTYLSMRADLDLTVLVEGPLEGGPELLANPYGIVAVNPAVHDSVNYDLAMSYIGFLTSPNGQQIIAEYTVDGRQLFFPQAISEEPNFQQYVPEGWRANETGTDRKTIRSSR